ncbi:MAG TPA: glycosyltransferase family 1 protein [Gammaproteobacteria bacterium]|jgi:glycosyltransferase involved in cell wall biosynthesis|nr:glycosyltransferase family 1 protein [Gammaproteobacteria bacterium]
MQSNTPIIADGRWLGTHGIGRFTEEVLNRLHHTEILKKGPSPLSCKNLFWQPYYLYQQRKKFKVFFTPGFNPVIKSAIPAIITIADLIHLFGPEKPSYFKKYFYEYLIKPSLHQSYKIFTVSEFSKQSIMEWGQVSGDKIVNVGCGISNVFLAEGEKHLPGYPYLLYVGNMKTHKNIPRLLKAFARANFDGKLILIGQETPLIVDLIQKLHITHRVIFCKNVTENALAKYYRGATALLFPSLYEGFGLPPLEAMACGTPVLTSNVTSLPEVSGDAALLVNPYEEAAIAEGIQQIVHDDTLRKNLIAKGFARAQLFSWDKTADKIQNVLDGV